MENGVISLTVEAETFYMYKEAYDKLEQNYHAINLGDKGWYQYKWEFFTKDKAIDEMAKQCEFINSKHREQLSKDFYLLNQRINSLELELSLLKSSIDNEN